MPDVKTETGQHQPFDVQSVREQFPILHQQVNGYPLVYFDNAATTQKPVTVLDRINGYYRSINSNVHRGVHKLSQQATDAYEESREVVQGFINARSTKEVIFTRGTTEAINLVANSFGNRFFRKGDEVVLTTMEHHSNIVPWQLACEKTGAHLKVAPINEQGDLITEELEKLLNEKTRLITLPHVSNALGTINPVKEVIELAKKHDIPVLLDGAQAVAHTEVDVQELDCDFYCFSGHKMFGPTGIGILFGKEKWLEEMPPYQGGGDMIDRVTFEHTTYNALPNKFEAGTPHISGVIGLSEAVKFIQSIGVENIALYEDKLLQYATQEMNKLGGIRFVGTAKHKAAVISFLPDGIHPYDAGTILDQMGIAIRTGHHCTQPLMDFYGIPGTARASFSLYNTTGEIDRLIEGLKKVQKMLK